MYTGMPIKTVPSVLLGWMLSAAYYFFFQIVVCFPFHKQERGIFYTLCWISNFKLPYFVCCLFSVFLDAESDGICRICTLRSALPRAAIHGMLAMIRHGWIGSMKGFEPLSFLQVLVIQGYFSLIQLLILWDLPAHEKFY